MSALGTQFAREIAEQPALWRRLAGETHAAQLAQAIAGRGVLLIGSGSSLFVAQLGALALRRRGIRASALAATEARFDHAAYEGCCVVALSQSGRSADVLAALDIVRPEPLVALTNSPDSPLAARADRVIDVAAGPERAVPATKSVTAMAAIALWAAALAGGEPTRDALRLRELADAVERWLHDDGVAAIERAAHALRDVASLIFIGAGYGVPIASELALKHKEACYVHAEGFAAGEFRHGSVAMLDPSCALIAVVDDASIPIVEPPVRAAERAGSRVFTIGGALPSVSALGPAVDPAFNTLAWLMTGQLLALHIARLRGIESDAPRGLTKVVG